MEARYYVQANTIFRRPQHGAYPLAFDLDRVCEMLNRYDALLSEVSTHAPEEVWALHPPGDPTGLVPPIDDPGCDVFLACPSKEDAEKLAENQSQWFDGVNPTPIRLK